ncbi:tetratricopeptide repeat protein [Ideonella alba]|uniref:tetratricopeptide repeat protein n=1 Tax=Ideonella alba TaxID=2824118 RepID=UPI001FFD8814|nr:tetratricopeptide repeat protein [Ideonella alba]
MSAPADPAQLRDQRDQRLGTASRAAADAAETALWRLVSQIGSPEEALDQACAADPAWAWPPLMRAGHRLLQADGRLDDSTRVALAVASRHIEGAPPREQRHLAALQALAEGRCAAACQVWDDLLLDHPHDALALLWAQAWDLRRGELPPLQTRPAEVLPEWSPEDPLHPHLLGLYAFGLQENQRDAQAEEVARRALAREPQVPRAVLAVAHVMESQGRFDDGTAWLRQHQAGWADDSALAAHLWWHMGLFRLEALDLSGVHRLIDAHLSGTALVGDADHRDAVALLWRLHLLGEDVGARLVQLLAAWPADEGEAGLCAFHDLHVLLCLLGADELVRAERWVARVAARAMQAEDARRSNHAVTREVALPVMRALLSMARGDAGAACSALRASRPHWPRLGGSRLQRDLLELTLIAAAARAPQPALHRALLNARRLARAASPLLRHLEAH